MKNIVNMILDKDKYFRDHPSSTYIHASDMVRPSNVHFEKVWKPFLEFQKAIDTCREYALADDMDALKNRFAKMFYSSYGMKLFVHRRFMVLLSYVFNHDVEACATFLADVYPHDSLAEWGISLEKFKNEISVKNLKYVSAKIGPKTSKSYLKTTISSLKSPF